MTHQMYMRRALQIARRGFPNAMPNPMVGAVIVDPGASDASAGHKPAHLGRIIGEGYHRLCGEAHAEVNAIAAVSDREALRRSTMYVTLEPCAHYGRTGPCAKLIIETGIPRVVVGCRDPFEKVDGRGIEMLRNAGVEVIVGVLEDECRKLNAMFFTAHTLHRPFIILKWAQTPDHWLDVAREPGQPAHRISNDITSMMAHRLRAACDGILVGSNTVLADNPTLNTRLWPGKSPRPIVLDRRGRVGAEAAILGRSPLIVSDDRPLPEIMGALYRQGITSLLVEGGAEVLRSFIDTGLWDLARVETGLECLDVYGRVRAPQIPDRDPVKTVEMEGHIVKFYSNNDLIDVKNL